MKWTAKEEAKLSDLHFEGKSVKEISKILKRQPGGIRARLNRLLNFAK